MTLPTNIDDATRAELHDLAVQAEALQPLVRSLAQRSFRALSVYEAAQWGEDANGRWANAGVLFTLLSSDDRYEALREESGAGRLLDALYELVNQLEPGRLERPDSDPDWLAVERHHTAERYPEMGWKHRS